MAKFRPIWSHCWWPWWRGQKIDNFLIGLMLISTSAPGTKKPNSWKISEIRKNKKDLKWMLMPCQTLHDSRVNFRHLGKNSNILRQLLEVYLPCSWQKLGNFFGKKCYWANLNDCKWWNIEQSIPVTLLQKHIGHTCVWMFLNRLLSTPHWTKWYFSKKWVK